MTKRALAALALLLTACTSTPTDNNTLAIALPFEPVASLSPFSDDALMTTRIGVGETLVGLDDNGVAQPWLAQSFTRPDDSTVVFTLRDDATFHDGTPVNAEAVVRSLQAAWDAASRPKGLGKTPLSFEAVDEHTVKVTSEKPDPILPQRFADSGTIILAQAAYKDPANPTIVGTATGPYVLDSVTTTEATTHKNEKYWDGTPKLDTLTVDFIPDGPARTNAIRAGEVAMAQAVPIAQLSSLGDAELQSTPLPRGVYLHLNSARGPFTDPKLRAAAAKAVNPNDIVTTIYENHAGKADGSIFSTEANWAVKSANTTTDAADPNGTTIRLATWTERPELGEVASVIAEQLRAAGFNVDITVTDYNSLEKALLDGEFDAVIGSRNYQLGAADPVSFLASDYSCDGSYNLSRFCDATIDAAIDKASSISDVEQRFEEAARIGADIVAANAVIPLAHEYSINAVNHVNDLSKDPFERRLITVDTHR